jgi:hypothetical protein
MMPAHDALDGVAAIAEKMPAIGDVDRFGRALPCALGIHICPVSGDDLNAGMVAQPSGESLGLAIRQQVDDPVALEVDENGSIAAGAAPRPLINTKNPRCRCRLRRSLPDQAEQGVGARRQGQPAGEPCAGLAAEC